MDSLHSHRNVPEIAFHASAEPPAAHAFHARLLCQREALRLVEAQWQLGVMAGGGSITAFTTRADRKATSTKD
jgi:hypothetical protein